MPQRGSISILNNKKWGALARLPCYNRMTTVVIVAIQFFGAILVVMGKAYATDVLHSSK